jgi:phosphatidylglycerophosphate synthase
MFDIRLRGWKDRAVDPLSRILPSFVTPGHITSAAFVCGLVSCLLAATPPPPPSHLSRGRLALALAFWLANRFLDCLDGSLARTRGCATQLGGFWDLLSDFIVFSLLPIAVARGQAELISVDWTALALLEASFHVNNFVLFYLAAVAAAKQDAELTSVTMKPALVEGFESGLLFTAMLIWPARINTWSWLMATAVVFGTAQRIWALVPLLRRLDLSTKTRSKQVITRAKIEREKKIKSDE